MPITIAASTMEHPMIVRYTHPSRIGTFSLRLQNDGRWHIWCEDEDLGSRHSAVSALEELCNGSTDWPGVTNPATLGLPDELSEWKAWSAGK